MTTPATTGGGGWGGSALFSYGFRPFFLFAALHAAVMIGLWVPWFLGFLGLASGFPPAAWHAHELLFGYVPAVMAGFLLTAVPNWTGRQPLRGWKLMLLLALWLGGRAAIALSSVIGLPAAAMASLVFPLALIATIGSGIIAARNWRNLVVVALLSLFAASQMLLEWEIWRFGQSVHGDRLAIAAALLLITLIGGRIIPLFTGNWLKQRGASSLPAPIGRYDLAALAVGAAALAAWVLGDDGFVPRIPLGALLLFAGVLHLGRQLRWQPHRTGAEPLVAVLHVAYAFVPAGFILSGCAVLLDSASYVTAGIHAWTAGAIGTMTIAVMTRVSLGHSGRALRASWPTTLIYVAIVAAAVARVVVALWPEWTMTLMPLAGLAWVLAFLGFAAVYGPMLLTPRR